MRSCRFTARLIITFFSQTKSTFRNARMTLTDFYNHFILRDLVMRISKAGRIGRGLPPANEVAHYAPYFQAVLIDGFWCTTDDIPPDVTEMHRSGWLHSETFEVEKSPYDSNVEFTLPSPFHATYYSSLFSAESAGPTPGNLRMFVIDILGCFDPNRLAFQSCSAGLDSNSPPPRSTISTGVLSCGPKRLRRNYSCLPSIVLGTRCSQTGLHRLPHPIDGLGYRIFGR